MILDDKLLNDLLAEFDALITTVEGFAVRDGDAGVKTRAYATTDKARAIGWRVAEAMVAADDTRRRLESGIA
jgi:predicted regulator of Ras-like GTPase activity (Roadblock/LC7/MglB family)